MGGFVASGTSWARSGDEWGDRGRSWDPATESLSTRRSSKRKASASTIKSSRNKSISHGSSRKAEEGNKSGADPEAAINNMRSIKSKESIKGLSRLNRWTKVQMGAIIGVLVSATLIGGLVVGQPYFRDSKGGRVAGNVAAGLGAAGIIAGGILAVVAVKKAAKASADAEDALTSLELKQYRTKKDKTV